MDGSKEQDALDYQHQTSPHSKGQEDLPRKNTQAYKVHLLPEPETSRNITEQYIYMDLLNKGIALQAADKWARHIWTNATVLERHQYKQHEKRSRTSTLPPFMSEDQVIGYVTAYQLYSTTDWVVLDRFYNKLENILTEVRYVTDRHHLSVPSFPVYKFKDNTNKVTVPIIQVPIPRATNQQATVYGQVRSWKHTALRSMTLQMDKLNCRKEQVTPGQIPAHHPLRYGQDLIMSQPEVEINYDSDITNLTGPVRTLIIQEPQSQVSQMQEDTLTELEHSIKEFSELSKIPTGKSFEQDTSKAESNQSSMANKLNQSVSRKRSHELEAESPGTSKPNNKWLRDSNPQPTSTDLAHYQQDPGKECHADKPDQIDQALIANTSYTVEGRPAIEKDRNIVNFSQSDINNRTLIKQAEDRRTFNLPPNTQQEEQRTEDSQLLDAIASINSIQQEDQPETPPNQDASCTSDEPESPPPLLIASSEIRYQTTQADQPPTLVNHLTLSHGTTQRSVCNTNTSLDAPRTTNTWTASTTQKVLPSPRSGLPSLTPTSSTQPGESHRTSTINHGLSRPHRPATPYPTASTAQALPYSATLYSAQSTHDAVLNYQRTHQLDTQDHTFPDPRTGYTPFQ